MEPLLLSLNARQSAFALQYVANGGNGTKAAREVCNVTSNNSAAVVASRMLRNVKVREVIQGRMDQKMSEEEVLVRLLQLARNAKREDIQLRALIEVSRIRGYT